MSTMRVVVRCDAGPNVGLGHLMRCVSLSHALRSIGADVVFLMRGDDETSSFRHYLTAFSSVNLPWPADGDESATLGADDAVTVLRAAGTESLIVIDHYGADAEYFHRLRSAVGRLFVLDDLGNRDLSLASWILNPAPLADTMPYRVGPQTKCLFGPAYALLRPEFRRVRRRHTATHSDPLRILVSLGGGDHGEEWRAVLESLATVDANLEIFCFAGYQSNSDAGKHPVQWLGSVEHPAEIMATMDMAVAASGSTVWELCCLGIPMVIRALAENQIPNAQALEAAGCAAVVWNQAPGEMADAVRNLLKDAPLRAVMSARGYELVDGLGAQRAASAVFPPTESGMMSHAI